MIICHQPQRSLLANIFVSISCLLMINTINKLLLMNSSLSFISNRDKIAPRKLDFQKDIIMPHIYANENFELIKNNSYPVRHERKVITAKKAKVRSIVEAIVSKKQIEVSKKTPTYQHRLSKPINLVKRKTMPALTPFQPDNLTMDIDEKLNEKAIYYQQQSAVLKQKVREAMEKVKGKNQSFTVGQQNQSVNFYITQLSPPQKAPPISIQQVYFAVQKPSKQAKGFVEEQEEKQAKWKLRNRRQINTRTQMVTKPRPKTAGQVSKSRSLSKKNNMSHHDSGIFRSNSLMNTRLSRIGVGGQVIENLKLSQRNSAQKQRIQNLFDMIQENCLTSTLSKGKLIAEMNKLGMLWKSQKQFLDTHQGATVLSLSQESFSLLKSIRKQQSQIKRLDENILSPSETAKNSKNMFTENTGNKNK